MNATEPPPTAPARLDSSDLLVAEFNYIAESAFQANEDRARVSQFFFVTFGTFIAAIFSSLLSNVSLQTIYTAFAIVFFVVTCLGGLTLGSAITFFALARGATQVPWGWASVGGLVTLTGLVVFCYWLPLRQSGGVSK